MICQYCKLSFDVEVEEFVKHVKNCMAEESQDNQPKKEVLKKMVTLRETAKEFVPPQTKNIADLDKFSVDFEMFDGNGVDKDGEPFTYKYVEVNGEQYRVPGKVIGDIKKILEANPNTKFLKVSKSGSGRATQYTVIQLAN